MEIKAIAFDETVSLRHEILRPDLSLSMCCYPGDKDSSTFHFGGFLDDSLVGIVSVYRRSLASIPTGQGYQVRAMAVVEASRGTGLGSQLLKAAENVSFDAGAEYVWANARVSAREFYEKSNYKVVGDPFNIEDVGKHVLIVKHEQ